MAVHGDVTEIQFNHPEIGSGTIFPKANEDNTLDLGGFRNNDDASQINGAGDLIVQKNRVRGSWEGAVENDNNTREDMKKMVDICESAVSAEWTFTHVSGAIYKGQGVPVGDLQAGLNSGTFNLKIAVGNMRKIPG
jgi:hypothetical protein